MTTREEKEETRLQERKDYYILLDQYLKGYHLSDNDKAELIRLNHIIMEGTHRVHNDNMLNIL